MSFYLQLYFYFRSTRPWSQFARNKSNNWTCSCNIWNIKSCRWDVNIHEAKKTFAISIISVTKYRFQSLVPVAFNVFFVCQFAQAAFEQVERFSVERILSHGTPYVLPVSRNFTAKKRSKIAGQVIHQSIQLPPLSQPRDYAEISRALGTYTVHRQGR